jgi:hypothetical protein
MSKSWGVYYIPSRQARLFGGYEPELYATLETEKEAQEVCNDLNNFGPIDDTHIGYAIEPITGDNNE